MTISTSTELAEAGEIPLKRDLSARAKALKVEMVTRL